MPKDEPTLRSGDLIALRTCCSAGDGSARSDAAASSAPKIDNRKIDMRSVELREKRSALKEHRYLVRQSDGLVLVVGPWRPLRVSPAVVL